MNRNESIRRLLAEAPSTCPEIADILEISVRSARVGIRKTGGVVPEAGGKGHGLYELTERGRSAPLATWSRRKKPAPPDAQAERRAEYLREVGRTEGE